jgi:uncharacterized protein (DUF488 family)
MDRPLIYTIGHSTHPLEYFLSLLREYAIDCLVDVRSIAASARNPQYNKQPLSKFLKANNIAYLHFAEEFGARQTDPGLLDDNGKVDFEKVRRSPIFRRGIERLSNGVTKGHIITLMCAESDPFDCHRFSMISPGLQNAGFQVQHILKDKTIISNEALEQQLLKNTPASFHNRPCSSRPSAPGNS